MPKLIIAAALWVMMAYGMTTRNDNVERKYQCSFGLGADVVTVILAPALFVIALVADNERVAPPSSCKNEEG